MGFIADVFDVVLKTSTGDVIGSTTMQSANIDIALTENEVRAGKGNALQSLIHSNRDITLNLSDVNFRYDILAQQLGQSIVTGAGTAYSMPKWYTASGATPKITLDQAPLATNNDLSIYKADGTKVTSGTLSGSDVTFSTGVVAGDRLEVRTYKYTTSAQTQAININVDSFPKGLFVVLETIEIDNEEVVTHKIQYQFTKAVLSGSFSLNTASERNASAQEFALRVLKPQDTNVMGTVLRIPISA